MYHLEQEEFLRAWIQVQDQDLFVVGEDLAWVDLVQDNWDTPMDWGGFYREDHHLEFRQVPHIRDYLWEIEKKKWHVETDGEYIWAENLIQETYQQQVQRIAEDIGGKRRPGRDFVYELRKRRYNLKEREIRRCLCQMAAELVGRGEKGTKRARKNGCRWFRAQVLEQIGSGCVGPFYIGLRQVVAIL